ncbi:hypothetical protein HAX54_017110 [Datura stramonium]|uniref:Uncharacterized protein n=1 Tax=Datura stramonium TaxID=4076 RepID=A0ABS8UMC7_DATST|nr:hypothetical protein [Datura stramonium]
MYELGQPGKLTLLLWILQLAQWMFPVPLRFVSTPILTNIATWASLYSRVIKHGKGNYVDNFTALQFISLVIISPMLNGNPDTRLATSTTQSSAKVLSPRVWTSRSRTTANQNIAANVSTPILTSIATWASLYSRVIKHGKGNEVDNFTDPQFIFLVTIAPMFNGNPDTRLATSTTLSSANVLSPPVLNSRSRTTSNQNYTANFSVDFTILS